MPLTQDPIISCLCQATLDEKECIIPITFRTHGPFIKITHKFGYKVVIGQFLMDM